MVLGTFLTLDVEAWYHHPGHRLGRDAELWDTLPSGLPGQMDAAFDLLDRIGSRATCFFLGWAALRYPELAREAVQRGHEVASHGMEHRPVRESNPSAFRDEARRSKEILEEISGFPVRGFRAPAWSIHGAEWAYEVLAECGYMYSSSRLPIPGLGWKRATDRVPAGFLEIPALASEWGAASFPAGGTIALRIAPLRLLEACRDEASEAGRPAVYWFHPWELDADSPELPGLSTAGRFQRYGLLRRLPGRLAHLAGGLGRTLGEAVLGELRGSR